MWVPIILLMGTVTKVKTRKGKKQYHKYIWIVPKHLVENYDIKELSFNGIDGNNMRLIVTKGRIEPNRNQKGSEKKPINKVGSEKVSTQIDSDMFNYAMKKGDK